LPGRLFWDYFLGFLARRLTMVGRGTKERERYWRGVIRDQKASGLSISAFCRERKVPEASFFSWRRKLTDRQRPVERKNTAAKFVALEVPPSPPVATRTGCEVVLPNGCRIIVSTQCDASWLREILGVLQEQSC
jgi:hypothetical protein